MRRNPSPPPHTCGWSPHDRRIVPNDECERCQLEDERILDTQVVDQHKRARLFRPARATASVRATSDAEAIEPEKPGLIRRRTFVPPIDGLDLDALL